MIDKVKFSTFKGIFFLLIVVTSFYAGLRWQSFTQEEPELRTKVVNLGNVTATKSGRLAIFSEFVNALKQYPRYDRVSVKWKFHTVRAIELGYDRVNIGIFITDGNTAGCGINESKIYELEKVLKKKNDLGFEYAGWWSSECGGGEG